MSCSPNQAPKSCVAMPYACSRTNPW
jgi:hypothetical protein